MNEYVMTIIGISIVFLSTTLGALSVFFIRKNKLSPKLTKIIIGLASGVMFSASFFSLIKPALETETTYMPTWAIVAISIGLGALFLWGIDKIVPHFHVSENKEEGVKTKKISKNSKMFLAVAIVVAIILVAWAITKLL